MDPITQFMMQGAAGAAGDATYVDDVFSTYLYTGQSTTKTITNGIDNLDKGGMLWVKNRDNARGHQLYDTERLASGSNTTSDYSLSSDSNGAARDMSPNGIVTWKNDGWSVPGGDGDINQNGFGDYASWNFRKQKGFFDVVTYTGNGTAGRTVSHSLGCEPGMIIIKNLDSTEDWRVYHRSLGGTHNLVLNSSAASAATSSVFNQTDPTASVFTVGTSDATNKNGDNFVAYVFAGGASTAANARSVEFDGSGDYLTTNTSSDYTLGTGDFTLEYWYKPDTVNYSTFLVDANTGSEVWATYCNVNGQHKYRVNGTDEIISTTPLRYNQWHHIAIVRSSGTTKMYVNGTQEGASMSDSTNYTFTSVVIGRRVSAGDLQYDGEISNLRLVKGTAVYTSSFRPTYEPLTSISGTSLLCCNNSSVTGTTTGTVTSSGNPTASTDSPFDDPEGFKFGEEGDQNIIKCGSHSHSSTNPIRIYTGFEPQWIMLKNATQSSNWAMYDVMRGIFVGSDGPSLTADTNTAENGVLGQGQPLTPHGDGFTLNYGLTAVNPGNGNTVIYIAIRKSDGYVGKPAEAGTNAFAMDTGNGSSSGPCFDSTFAVDFALRKIYGSTDDWWAVNRLTGKKYLKTNATSAESNHNDNPMDFTDGWAAGSIGSGMQSWMWKRGAGFDAVAFQGTATDPGRDYAHSLGKTPELKFIKRRNSSTDWMGTGTVVSQAMAGNNNSMDYFVKLNSTDAATNSSNYWTGGNDSSTHFTVRHGNSALGGSNDPYLCLLFASVEGISKVGSYNGTGSVGLQITTGFSPRFLILKRANASGPWYVLDTTRGWAGGNDQYLLLNTADAQSPYEFGVPNATGFQLDITASQVNESGGKYIYYAHA